MKEELYNILSSEGKDEKKQEEESTEIGGKPIEETLAYQRAYIEKMREENENLKQDREQRKIFGYCIFAFMCVYMIIAISIVFMCGWGKIQLSDMVIITLIGSTLVEVIGIFNFVVRYLFHKRF